MKITFYKLLFATTIIVLSACKKDDSYEPLIDEPTFTNQVSGTTNRLTRIQFVNANVGYVSGRTGTIIKTENGGDTWKLQSVSTTEHIQSVNFADEQTGWLTGAKGIMYATVDGGTTWNKQILPTTTETMNDVKFVSKTTGFVVGAKGLIYKTTDGGANWVTQSNFDTLGMRAGTVANVIANAGTPNATVGTIAATTLNFIFPVTENELYILGNSGIVLKTVDGGVTWKWQNTGTNNALYSMQFPNTNAGFVCGANGTVLKTTGNGIYVNAAAKANTRSFRDIYFSSNSNGWAIGEHGYIFKSTDGGNYWGNEMYPEMIYILYACAFTDSKTGYFVGNNGTIIKVKDI